MRIPNNPGWLRSGLRALPGVLGSLLLFVLFCLGSCRGCQQDQESRREDVIPPQCGECLDLHTGEVCTSRGTMRNSCLAICLSQKILCSQACPCPSH